MQVTDLQISSITIGERFREPLAHRVKELAETLRVEPLLHPIAVTQDLRLIAGLHRLEAFKLLGRETIPAQVLEVDAEQAELLELDENLRRNQFLTGPQFTSAVERRKFLWNRQQHKTGWGGNRRGEDFKRANMPLEKSLSFVEDTAAATGVSETKIKEEIRIAEKLSKPARKAYDKGEINRTKALQVAKLPKSEQPAALKQTTTATVKPALTPADCRASLTNLANLFRLTWDKHRDNVGAWEQEERNAVGLVLDDFSDLVSGAAETILTAE